MAFQFKDLSILIVDDDPTIREITHTVLEQLDFFRIDTAEDGKIAFEIFQQHNHDLVITDWQMEDLDGIDLTHMLRSPNTNSPNRKVPIILATGFTNPDMISAARNAGVHELLIKPYTADDLAKRIAYVMNKPRTFIDNDSYFGPDRRRRQAPDYPGPDRRNKGGK